MFMTSAKISLAYSQQWYPVGFAGVNESIEKKKK
jgi:hypothetical protein